MPTELISMRLTDVMMMGIVSPFGMRLQRLSEISTSQIVKAIPLFAVAFDHVDVASV